MIRHHLAVALAAAVMACGPVRSRSVQPDRGLAGSWQICLTGERALATPACGALYATPDSIRRGRSTVRYFRLEHDAPLANVLDRSQPVPRFGVAYPMGGNRWGIRLAVAAGVLDARGGDIWTDLIMDGDSLAGEWIAQCVGACAERGRVVLRRAAPDSRQP